MASGVPGLVEVLGGGKRALARALACVETHAETADLTALLDAAAAAPRARVVGLTGPPGVGKSTLTRALVKVWRARGEKVGVLAVDPSSRLSGGALLGDRARIAGEGADEGLFIRSMAARDRLGGLSDASFAAAALMRAVFDRLLVETVGVGQSEDDVALVADALVLCVQPASGDGLQFMKAGLMERPDALVVTKADLGASAARALFELESALRLAASDGRPAPPALLVSAATGEGLDALVACLDRATEDGAVAPRRARQSRAWVEQSLRVRFGVEGLAAVADRLAEPSHLGPFALERRLAGLLRARLRGAGDPK